MMLGDEGGGGSDETKPPNKTITTRTSPLDPIQSSSSSCGWSGICGAGGGGTTETAGGGGDHHHHQQKEMVTSDSELARQLQELTVQERNQLYEEIHGVSKIPVEEPEMIERKLRQLEMEIQRIKDNDKNKSAYNKALFFAPRLVTSRKFQLLFLRAAEFDPRDAASRIIQHFQNKLELFGESNLGKDITIEDLSADDRIALQSGSTMFLPHTDMAGRGVSVLSRIYINPKITLDNQMRAHWYSFMAALENETIQKRGVVYVCYDLGCTLRDSIAFTELIVRMAKIRNGLPFRLACLQFCYDDPATKPFLSVLRTKAGSEAYLRSRIHFGSHQECQYGLMSFGIPMTIFPVDNQGRLSRCMISNFIETRMAKEEERRQREKNDNQYDAATNNDILLGRGKPSQNHPGNMQLAQLIEERRTAYYEADRFEKLCISWEIVKTMQSDKGGRFLEKDGSSGAWRVVHDDIAREKVAYGFRSSKKLHGSI